MSDEKIVMATTEVIARNGQIAKFSIPTGPRKEMEEVIANKLRSIVWADDDGGINVVCISDNNDVWRPRRKFFLKDQSETGGGE